MRSMLLMMVSLAAVGEETKISGVWQTTFRTSYVAPQGIVVHDEPVIENELTLSFGKFGWYAGIWTSVPFDKPAPLTAEATETDPPVFSNERLALTYQVLSDIRDIALILDPPDPAPPPFEGEIDYYFGKRLTLGNIELDASLWWYDFNKVGEYGDDQWSAQVIANYTRFRIKPYLQLNYYGETGSLSPESGWFAYGGVRHQFSLGVTEVELGAQAAYSLDGAFGCDSGLVYVRLNASATVPLSKRIALMPSLTYQIAGPEQHGGARDYIDGDTWFAGLSIRATF